MDENSKEINTLQREDDGLVPEGNNQAGKEVSSPSKPPQKGRKGRPPGAKNKDTLFKELMTGEFQQIAEQNIKKTFEVLFEEAHEGNMQAIKMVLDRVVPVTKAVDLADMEKKGLTISINVGNLEDTVSVSADEPDFVGRVEDPPIEAEFEEVKEG